MNYDLLTNLSNKVTLVEELILISITYERKRALAIAWKVANGSAGQRTHNACRKKRVAYVKKQSVEACLFSQQHQPRSFSVRFCLDGWQSGVGVVNQLTVNHS